MTDLPDLTPKQLAFFEACQSGMSDKDAYRHAYDCEKMQDRDIYVEAWRARKNPKLAQWFNHAKQQAMKVALQSKEAYLQETERLKSVCEAEKNYGAAVKAHELAGKVMGHYVDKSEDVTKRPDPASVLAEIEMKSPELAALLRARMGDSDEKEPTVQ